VKPQFFYPVVKMTQPSMLPGVSASIVTVVPEGEVGHCYVNGAILCSANVADVLSRLKQAGNKVSKSIVSQRKEGVPVCEECIERWKRHPDSDWQQWEQSTKLTAAEVFRV
jgi:hypothetical protein